MFVKFVLTLILTMAIFSDTSNSAAQNSKYVICYQGTWSTYRPGMGKYDVSDIDPFLCTHLVYAFFGIEESGEIRIIDPYLDMEDNWGRGNIAKFNALKLKNPTLKTLAAVGGWNEGSKNFSIVAADAERRARFVNSVVRFVQRHGFDGLDLDWEYPGQRHHLPTANEDRKNFITLIKELHEGLEPFGYMLTAAVASAEYSASISYDISEIVKYLDLINVMCYDLNGAWSDYIGINAPLYEGDSDQTAKQKQLNVDAIIKYWLKAGAPREKLVLGVPFYGRTFTLKDAAQITPGSAHIGRGIAGPYSREPGVIGYNEICEKFQQESWTLSWEPKQMVPYAYRERQWIGFESTQSLRLKAQYVLDNNLAGIMVWSLESDDFHGTCSKNKERYPLLKEINRVLFKADTPNGLNEAIKTTSNFAIQYDHNSVAQCSGNSGYMRDAKDCSKFYYCTAEGVAYSFRCPNSLKFDLITSSCNFAPLVQC